MAGVYTKVNGTHEFAVSDKIIVKLKNESDLNILLGKYNLKKIEKEWLGDKVFLLQINQLNENLTFEIANQIYESGLVEFSHPDFIAFNWTESTPNDIYFGNQWNLTKISVPSAWDISTGSSSITIAIIDAGVQSTHEDIDDHLIPGYDVVGNDNITDPVWDYDHRTKCAGVASAETNNGTYIAGVGYNCKIMPIQISYSGDWHHSGNFAAGINWASSHGAHIISISGSTDEADVVYNAINSATSTGRNGKGCVVVKSAGNNGQHEDHEISYPGKHPKVICVGGTNQADNKIPESSFGPELDVMAPTGVYSITNFGYTTNFSLTSSAAPHVAGLAGLILAYKSTLSEEEVRKIICYSADDIYPTGFDEGTGYGRINAWRALDAISHVTTSGNLLKDEIWTGTVTLSGKLLIPSGVKLTILSTATVNLTTGNNRYSIISTGGLVNVDGSPTLNGCIATTPYYLPPYNGIFVSIQTAINNNQLGPIHIKPGTFSQGISISNSNQYIIIYGDFYNGGTTIPSINLSNNTNTIYISDLTTHYIALYNCSFPYFGYINIEPLYPDVDYSFLAYNSGSTDLYLDNSSLNNTPEGAGAVFYNSEGHIRYSDFIYNQLATSFIFGSDFYLTGGSNGNFFCSNDMDIITDSYSNADYINGIFSGDPNLTTEGNVNWGYSYSTCMAKVNPSATGNNTDNSNGNLNPEILEDETDLAIKIDSLKTYINSNLSSKVILKDFRKLIRLYKRYDIEKMYMYLQETNSGKEFGNLSFWAKRHMIDYYNVKKEFDKSILIANELLKESNVDTAIICEVLLEKGLIYQYSLVNIQEAIKSFSSIVTNYPGNQLAVVSKRILTELDPNSSNHKEVPRIQAGNKIEFALSSYPNPFNPTTTISYTLPEREFVTLKLYDILGKEIAELVNEEKGSYSITFDGSSLSSGIYFYSITAGKFNQVKKMTLLR